MDCHVFRRLCDALCPLLQDARIEKIHQPVSGLVTISLYTGRRKTTLFLRADRQRPFLFVSAHRLSAQAPPSAFIMRLRKYCAGQRIIETRALWTERRLLLHLHGHSDTSMPLWLALDLKEGPLLLTGEQPFPPDESCWPDYTGEILSIPTNWTQYPVMSPALRKTLALLESGEQKALLADLQDGNGDIYAYTPSSDHSSAKSELSAWPLPEPLVANRVKRVFDMPLEAASYIGENVILAELAAEAGKKDAKIYLEKARKLSRLISKLEEESSRLQKMAANKQQALALQAELYRFAPDWKGETVYLEHLGEHIPLNPQKTLRENMQFLFHQAERGKRGLQLLQPRITSLRQQLDEEQHLAETAGRRSTVIEFPAVQNSLKSNGKAKKEKSSLPANIQCFRSTDGMLMLRGRDASGNARLLKLGHPHDYWLHVGGAAGAHVIIRRDHAGQIVPEQTLLQAGRLALEKSERRDDATAEVIMAQLRYIHAIKGAHAGAVRIENIERSFTVTPAEIAPAIPWNK